MNHRHHRAKSTSEPTTGLFATLSTLLRTGGCGGPGGVVGRTSSLRLLGIAFILAAAFSAMTASFALAARGHVYDEAASFGAPGAEAGQLALLAATGEEPGSGLAVNQATAEIYVADTGSHRVDQFSASGEFIRAFGWGVKDGAAKAEVCTTLTGCQAGIAGTEPGQFETPTSIAIDNSPGGEGDVYVADYAGLGSPDSMVQKFSAVGELITTWAEGGQLREGPATGGETFGRIGGLGVDPSGDLRAAASGPLFEFTQGGALVQFVSAISSLEGPAVALAIDAGGDSYINGSNTFRSSVHVFDPAGTHLGGVYSTERPSAGIALDNAGEFAGELYVAEGASIAIVPGSCTPRESKPFCAASGFFGPPQLGGVAGLAADSATSTVYAADTAANRIDAFTPEPPSRPLPGPASVSAVTSESATLEAELDPRSLEGEAPTTYYFEYGPCDADCATAPFISATPTATLPPDFEVHPVSATVNGLLPASAYHFRLQASNAQGPAEGKAATFTTQNTAPVALPDVRQWELVSPAQKLGARVLPITETGVVQAAVAGGGLTYRTSTPTEAEPPGFGNTEEQVLARRGPVRWSSQDLSVPHRSPTTKAFGAGKEYKFFNPDLDLSAVQPFGQFNPDLSPLATESTPFLHGLGAGCASSCFTPLVTAANVTPAGAKFGEEEACEPGNPSGRLYPFCGPELLGASGALAHLVLRSTPPLIEDAGESQLYEWSAGALAQVSILPAGEAATAAELGQTDRSARHAISEDGRLVFWTAEGRLYVRDMQSVETLQLDLPAAGCSTCNPGGGGSFQGASGDGTRVYFTDRQRLTSGSGADGTLADLYRCDLALVAGELSCALTDLTPIHGAEPAAVRGGILGLSEGGQDVYFVANGVLTEAPNSRGEVATPGNCGEESSSIEGASCNLYLSAGGQVRFIAPVSGLDGTDWAAALYSQPTRVSPNGRWLEFLSAARPTGYDNRDLATGRPVAESYLYDSSSGRIVCASCEPSGGRPRGFRYKPLEPGDGGLVGGPRGLWSSGDGLVAATVPGTTAVTGGNGQQQPVYLSNSGRLFFNASGGLVPGDSNGNFDVYEYEPEGIGDCSMSAATYHTAQGGCTSLISSGSSGRESAFLDASESGDDVFFITYSRLAAADTDNQLDVYDAHACSAAAPCFSEPAPPAPCAGEACQAASTSPAKPSAQTSAFAGPGNASRCPKGRVKHKGRCVKKHAKKKHHKNGHKKQQRAAGHNRGARR